MSVKIILDAGHFAKYNRSPVVPEYWESVQMWKLKDYLKAALEQYPGVVVGETRKYQSIDKEVSRRGRDAKGYDLLISLHSNAADAERVDRVCGIHQIPRADKPFTARSKELAEALAKRVAVVMETNDPPKWYDRTSTTDRDGDGVLNDNYYGILHGAFMAGVPAVILEHSFHTNTRAARWLLDDSNLQRLAEAEAAVLAEYYGLTKPTRQKGDVNGDGKIDAVDYVMAKRIFLGTYKATPEQLWAADVDGDGKIGAKDYLFIKRHAIGTLKISDYIEAFMLTKTNILKGE